MLPLERVEKRDRCPLLIYCARFSESKGKLILKPAIIAILPVKDAKNMPVEEVSKPSNITAQKALIQRFGQSILL